MENVPPTVVSQLSAKSEARASARASHGDPATDHRVGYASNSVGRSRWAIFGNARNTGILNKPIRSWLLPQWYLKPFMEMLQTLNAQRVLVAIGLLLTTWMSLGLFLSFGLWPAMFFLGALIKATYRLAIWLEDTIEKQIEQFYEGKVEKGLSQREIKESVAANMKIIRGGVGWFRDMAFSLNGFNVRRIVRYCRISDTLFGIRNPLYTDEHRNDAVGELDVGGRDAGFVTLIYGFSVFFLCICIAPPTCFGVWIQWPVWMGTLPLDQACWLVWQ